MTITETPPAAADPRTNLRIERRGRVVLVRLDRPQALNALSSELLRELVETLEPLDRDPDVGCFVLTGSDRAFAAGADIKEMRAKTFHDVVAEDYFAGWERFTALRTPKLAAVAGVALGGGCELAMMCDTIFAADNARFGQPEITLGVIPGIGGSQRLTRLVGKSKAMDMILTGRTMDAVEAERAGLVSRVFPLDDLVERTMDVARTVAGFGAPAVAAAREVVDRSLEVGLREGILFERRSFHSLFATDDRAEGMQAFLDKRPPVFTHR